MARPKVLAVLRLITNSNCVGCRTGISAGFRPFQNLSNVLTGLAVHPADAWAIARERANCRELPNKTYDGKLVPIGE